MQDRIAAYFEGEKMWIEKGQKLVEKEKGRTCRRRQQKQQQRLLYLNKFCLAWSNACIRATRSLCVDFKNVKILSIEPIFLSSNFVKYRRSSNRIRIVQCFNFSCLHENENKKKTQNKSSTCVQADRYLHA